MVLYAGNVGFSQSLEMVVAAAQSDAGADVLINGDGAARSSLEELADGSGQRSLLRLPAVERLAGGAGDRRHPSRAAEAGLGRVSVPSKTYSILAAGRPVLAAIDPGTEVPRILAESGGGVSRAARRPGGVPAGPAAARRRSPTRRARWAARTPWVEHAASPAAVAQAYADLIVELNRRR